MYDKYYKSARKDYFMPRNPGIPPGGNPLSPKNVEVARLAQGPITPAPDWRVGFNIPSAINNDALFAPFKNTGGRMVFPLNPTIMLSHTANYSNISPTHSNYIFHTYQNSQVDSIQVIGEFYIENSEDAKYWIASTHFLKTMTKMFYGDGDNSGKPPLVTRLNGYGKHVLNDIPVLISTVTVDLPKDVDYISCKIGNEETFVPIESQVAVTCLPNYSRATVSKFDLNAFARGEFIGSGKGFS